MNRLTFLSLPLSTVAVIAMVGGAYAAPRSTRATSAKTLKLPPLARKPGFVVGRAVFLDGRPLREFTVAVAGFDGKSVNVINGGVPTVGYATGHNGKYAVQTMDAFSRKKPTKAMVVNVSAQTKITYNGKAYTMDLHPLDGKASLRDAKGNGIWSTKGLSRDFVLKISGLIPGKDDKSDYLRRFAFYGTTLDLDDRSDTTVRDHFSPEAQLVFTLTPQGPLLDGSTGQTLTRKLPISALGTEAGRVLDIPVGVYCVQTKVVNGGVTTPLLLRVMWGDEAWKNAVVVDFPPSKSVGGAGSQTLEMQP